MPLVRVKVCNGNLRSSFQKVQTKPSRALISYVRLPHMCQGCVVCLHFCLCECQFVQVTLRAKDKTVNMLYRARERERVFI